jgi:hypothetical protein
MQAGQCRAASRVSMREEDQGKDAESLTGLAWTLTLKSPGCGSAAISDPTPASNYFIPVSVNALNNSSLTG